MPVTLQLMLVSILLTVFVAVPLAVYVALHPTGRIASLFLIGSSFFVSMPAFFVGLMALLVAAVWLKVAPVSRDGRRTCPAPSSTCGSRRWSSASHSSRS